MSAASVVRLAPPKVPAGPRWGRAHSIQAALRAGVWVTAATLGPVSQQEGSGDARRQYSRGRLGHHARQAVGGAAAAASG